MHSVTQDTFAKYQNIAPLCEKGHVMLVKNEEDGQLYVKKSISCYNPEIYVELQRNPIQNTPAIYEIKCEKEETEETTLTLIEEYIPGLTVAEILEEKEYFTEKETLNVAMQLCRILMDMHLRKPALIHRDIKPSNVMLLSDGTVKLLDFNAAKKGNHAQKRDTHLIGTAGYAAPEQYGFQAATPQTDIYAVGVLINIMLCRKMPSEQIASGKLKSIIRRCLEVNPKDRYYNVKELYRALKRKSEVIEEWLLPGFRTMRIYKMIPAILGYGLIIAVMIRAGSQSFDGAMEMLQYRMTVLLTSLMTIFFYCDYLGIRKYFPFMRSRNKWLRKLGYILNPVLIFWVIMFLIIIIEEIVKTYFF